MPPDPGDFRAVQAALAAYVRNPERHAPPDGVDPARARVYRDLLYRNVESLLAQAFPVLRTLSPEPAWHARVRDFFDRHRSRAPQFHRLSEEFLRFCLLERGEHPDDPPWLGELVHYEHVELALAIAPDPEDVVPVDPAGDLVEASPVIAPLAWPLGYAWPVHRLSPTFLPTTAPAQPTYLVVWRDTADAVRFLETNAATVRLLQLMGVRREATGRALLGQVAEEMRHPDPEVVLESGRAMLALLREKGIVLGTRIADPLSVGL